MEYPDHQVISKTQMQKMDLLLKDTQSEFSKTLTNLIFSANNPFQSNFNYIVDQTYLKHEQLKYA